MKKILVPTDFSKPAQWATEVAINIARKAAAEIILLHKVEQSTKDSFNVEGQVAGTDEWEDTLFTLKLIENDRTQLLKVAQEIELAGVSVKQQLRLGNPFHGISTCITDHDVDLVVMGTSSRSKLEEMMVGSNTEKVIRHSKCPVLTVHQRPSDCEFKDIVYATSMNDDEESFSEVIRSTQEMYNATVHLVRINTPMNFRPDTHVKSTLQDFAKKNRLKNYTLNIFNDLSEEEGILHFANSIQADLIGMATHGRTGFAHVLVGSIAEDVANHSKRPVLTYVTKAV
jgi:nucleotide-binding universal stress UspA family protein